MRLHDAQQLREVGPDIGLIERTLGTAKRPLAAPASSGDGQLATGLATRAATSTLLAALAAVRLRHTDRADQVLGFTNGEGRPPAPLRLDLSDEPTFAELLGRVELALAAIEDEGDLAPPDDEFETVFALEEDPPADARFDLWLTVQTAADGVHLKLHYDQRKRDAAAAEELLGHLETILEAGEEDPQQPITMLTLLTGAERERLLEEWTAAGPSSPVFFQEFFFSERAGGLGGGGLKGRGGELLNKEHQKCPPIL